MKKRLVVILALIIAICITIVSCDGETDLLGSGNIPSSLELTVDDALLNQEENNIKQVNFVANIPDYNSETMVVEWYVNGVIQSEKGKNFSYLPKLAGTYAVYAKLTYGETVLVSKQYKIVVFGTTMNVHIDVLEENKEDLLNQYVNGIKAITFKAEISNIVGMTEENAYKALVWYVDGKAVESSKGNSQFTYTPANKVDTIDVYAMVEDKYKSNYERVFVKMGDVELSTAQNNLAQSDENPQPVEFSASTLGAVVGQPVQWYVNDVLQNQKADTQTFTFTPSGNGVYKVYAQVGDIISDAEYVICGKSVSTESELRNALNNNVKAIVLNSDIVLSKYDSSTIALNIDNTVAIAGNGHKITASKKPSILVNISASDVVISDVDFVGAEKYALQFYKAWNSYVENTVVESAGYAGLHLNRSQVTVKDITIIDSNYAGIELSHPDYDANNSKDFATILTVLGDIDFSGKGLNIDGQVYEAPTAPIYSQNNEEACIVRSETFVEYVVSGIVDGKEMIIRRWCNDGCNIGWVVVPPAKTNYTVGDVLTLKDIALRAFVCDTTYSFDYSYLLMALDYKMVAQFDLLNADGEVINTLYARGYEYGTNALVFTDINGNEISGALTDTSIAQVSIKLGGAYVGKYSINVMPKDTVIEDNDNIGSGDINSGDIANN